MKNGKKIVSYSAVIFILSLPINQNGVAQELLTLKFESATISSDQLPEQFDETVTFECLSYSVNAESLLTVLSKSGVRVSRAWFPLDNRCMGIIGPRFTVELASDNPRILEFGFQQGSGRLRCASQLKQYSLTH